MSTETLTATKDWRTKNAPWRAERDAFYDKLNELMLNYKDQFVAIYQGRVVANGMDKFEVATSAEKRCGNVPIFVHRVSNEPIPVARVRSPRAAFQGV